MAKIKCFWSVFTLTYITLSLPYVSFVLYQCYGIDKLSFTGIFQLFQYICVNIIMVNISWIVSNCIYDRYYRIQKVKSSGKSVLITGCDTGFGNELAKRLDHLGFTVYATVLNPDGDGPKTLQKECSKNMKIMKMDVTKLNDVQNVVETIKKSGDTLWAVVNNAGIAMTSVIEFGKDCDSFNKIMNVNLLGVIRVTKQCLPLLRQSKGRVINMSSVAGRITLPGMYAYAASKHALRSFSDSLRREMRVFGIDVITIEPGFCRTPMLELNTLTESAKKEYNDTPDDVKDAYCGDEFLEYLLKAAEMTMKYACNMNAVIDAQINAVVLEKPKFYYRVWGSLEMLCFGILERMPESVQDLVFKFVFKILPFKNPIENQ